jgi:hypothetical protein
MARRPVNIRIDEDLLARIDALDDIDRTGFLHVAARALLEVWPPQVKRPAGALPPTALVDALDASTTVPEVVPQLDDTPTVTMVCPRHGRGALRSTGRCPLCSWKPPR